jgi:hypothetical protein
MDKLRGRHGLPGGEATERIRRGDRNRATERAEPGHADDPIDDLNVDLDDVAARGVALNRRRRGCRQVADPTGVEEAVEKLRAVHGSPA